MAMTIVEDKRAITGGVDTHADVHVAAALDPIGGLLGVREFPATAAGSLRIAALTASFLHGIGQNPAVPPAVSTQASTELAGGIPFLSDADLQTALTKAGASKQVTQAVLNENQPARLDGLRTALAALALLALIALFFSTRIPTRQPGSARTRQSEPHPDAAGAQTP
jgi:hypothetical protein